MKKRMAALAALLILSLLLPAASAAGPQRVEVWYNGFELGLEQPALALDGVTLVPVEEFLQKLGNQPASAMAGSTPYPEHVLTCWAGDGSSVLTATGLGHTIILQPGGSTVEIDGVSTALPAPAQLRGHTLYAPLRPLAEALGLRVEWNGGVSLCAEKDRIEVDSLEALFNAVDSHTEIVLAPGTYSFAGLDPSRIKNPHVLTYRDVETQTEEYEGDFELSIYGVCDLTITGPGAVISTPWAYADVLKLERCRRVTLEGLTALHDVPPGFCAGDCVQAEDCEGVLIHGCTLDGSGAYGLSAYDSRDITLTDTQIANCTYGALSLGNTAGVTVRACSIRSCRDCFHLLWAMGCRDILFDRCTIEDNSAGSLAECYEDSRGILFRGCAFRNNCLGTVNAYGWCAGGGAAFLDCTGVSSA